MENIGLTSRDSGPAFQNAPGTKDRAQPLGIGGKECALELGVRQILKTFGQEQGCDDSDTVPFSCNTIGNSRKVFRDSPMFLEKAFRPI